MKTNTILFTAFFFFSGIFATAQDQGDYLWTYEGKHKTHTIGLYGGLYGSYSELNSDGVGFLGLKGGVVFDRKLGVGLAGFALWYDKPLDALMTDGTYHLQAGYSGAYVEYIQPIGQHVKLSVSLLSGAGLALYQVDKPYESDLPWYDRILDQDNFSVLEPGFEVQTRIGKKWWLGGYATYRTTSPIRMRGTEEDILQNYTTGISIKYGVF